MSFGRLRQRIVLRCVPHVQHDYFSSFNQSDDGFLASSLPLLSSLLELPIIIATTLVIKKTFLSTLKNVITPCLRALKNEYLKTLLKDDQYFCTFAFIMNDSKSALLFKAL